MLSKKIGWVFIFLATFALLGYAREFFFVHINNIMYQKYYHVGSNLNTPPVMQIFFRFSYESLYYSKYVYTVLWTSLFLFMNYFALKKLTENRFLVRLLFLTYLLMIMLAGISMAFGLVVNGHWQDDEYTLSRWLMGIAQSPIICLILLASEKLYHKSFQS